MLTVVPRIHKFMRPFKACDFVRLNHVTYKGRGAVPIVG